jgi:hypothetical protein
MIDFDYKYCPPFDKAFGFWKGKACFSRIVGMLPASL